MLQNRATCHMVTAFKGNSGVVVGRRQHAVQSLAFLLPILGRKAIVSTII